MKRTLLFVITLSLMLAGCNSSSGDSSNLAPAAALSAEMVAAEAMIFSASPANTTGNIIEKDGNVNDPMDDYVLVERDAEGISFTYRDVPNNDVLGNTLSMRQFHASTGAGFTPSDFGAVVSAGSDNNFQRAEITDVANLNHTVNGVAVNGTLSSSNIIEVGGKAVGLQYADFGMWKTISTFAGTKNGVDASRTLMHDPEDWTGKMGSHANRADFAVGAANATFTGKAMGVARVHNGVGDDPAGAVFDEIYGNAKLDVNVAGRSANLELDFDQYYTFTFNNLEMERGGEFEERDNAANLVISAKKAGFNKNVDLTGATLRDFDVEGQFYGPNSTSPVEAVGDADITMRDPMNQTIEIDMAFGVKR